MTRNFNKSMARNLEEIMAHNFDKNMAQEISTVIWPQNSDPCGQNCHILSPTLTVHASTLFTHGLTSKFLNTNFEITTPNM